MDHKTGNNRPDAPCGTARLLAQVLRRLPPDQREALAPFAHPVDLALARLPVAATAASNPEHPGIDLHGQDRTTAIARLDLCLNRAFVRGVKQLSVVCGWILLDAVEEALRRHPLVKTFRREGARVVVAIVPFIEDVQ